MIGLSLNSSVVLGKGVKRRDLLAKNKIATLELFIKEFAQNY